MRKSRLLLAGALLAGSALFTGLSAAPFNITSQTKDASEPGRYILEVEIPPVAVEEVAVNGQVYHEFLVEDSGWLGRPGEPDLPALQRLIEIPDRSDVQLTFLDGEYTMLSGLNPLPCQERMHTEADLPLPWLQDEELYQRGGWYPVEHQALGEPALLRNHRVVKTSIFPVQVDPATGEARVWTSMRFEIGFEGQNPVNMKEFELAETSSWFRRLLAGRIFNPIAAADGAMEDMIYDTGLLPGNYVVFGRSFALADDSLQALLDWKRRKGHHVVTYDEGDVSFTTTGIRNKIIDEYQSEHAVDFVLLIGDVGGTFDLPTHSTYYDHHYAKIEGGDELGDVAVGRLSVDSQNQLATVANKIRFYESEPYMVDSHWLERAGFVVGSSACYLSMMTNSRGVAAEMVQRRQYSDIDTAWCVGSGNVIPWIEAGLSFYNYRGWVGMEGLSMTEVQNMSQGTRMPVAGLYTCGTGDFDYSDDFSEAFLRAGLGPDPDQVGGAVAAIGLATLSTHTRFNNVICAGYYGSLLEYDVPQIGSCMLHGKYELFLTLPPSEQDWAESFSYWCNLMGDPGTPAWAGIPTELEASPASVIGVGTDHIDLTVTSLGSPVEGAAVCAYQEQSGEDLQSTVLTDATGHALVPLSALEEGELLLTATHHRYVPLLHTYQVSAQAGDPAIRTWSVDGGSVVLPGAADQEFDFELQNVGTATLYDVSVTPSLDPAYGSMTADPMNPGTVTPGQTVPLSGVMLSPVNDLPDGEGLPLYLEISTSNYGDFTLLAYIPVSAPYISPGDQSFPSGVLQPGMTRTLRLDVTNLGSRTANSLQLTLVSDDPAMASVTSGTVSAGNLGVGSTTDADFEIYVESSVVVGQPLPMHVDWSAAGGDETGNIGLLVYVGSPGQDDPSGPDGYGYWAYENQDTGYAIAPAYDWQGITPMEGGSGDELALTDNGDEQDDALIVLLPFDFAYYGETYDRMLVCSNGFIAFDDYGFGEVDFRNHYMPTAQGPDAMIAPMWDDHESGNLGGNYGVYTWHDTVNDWFVISWYNLPANYYGGPNTFQLILYDPEIYPTGTGDGQFKFQYNDFNDTQEGYWSTDFNKCSIGIKDHTSTVGMALKNMGQIIPPTMHSVTDGTAILFTTSLGEFEDTYPPNITVVEPGVVYSGDPVTIEATITDHSGIAVATLNWNADGGGWNPVAMTDLGGNQWSADIPDQPSGTLVTYYVEATDDSENSNTGTSSQYDYTVYTLLFSESFDGASTFTHTAGPGLTDQWHLDPYRSYGGTHSWKFGGSGASSYDNDAGGILTSPGITLPDGASQTQVGFWSWIDAEASAFYPDSCYDGSLMEFNLDGGGWQRVTPVPDYPRYLRCDWASTASLVAWLGCPTEMLSGTEDWTYYAVAVPDGHSSLQFRFLFGSDSGGSAYEGWYVDEFIVTAVAPETPLDPIDDLEIILAGANVYLSWGAVAGATTYNIYSSTDPYDASPDLVATTGGTNILLPLSGGMKFYTVTADN